jgi:hypothetical protein
VEQHPHRPVDLVATGINRLQACSIHTAELVVDLLDQQLVPRLVAQAEQAHLDAVVVVVAGASQAA